MLLFLLLYVQLTVVIATAYANDTAFVGAVAAVDVHVLLPLASVIAPDTLAAASVAAFAPEMCLFTLPMLCLLYIGYYCCCPAAVACNVLTFCCAVTVHCSAEASSAS